jgi:uncharacterized damage-inducible protein DinB
MSTILIPRPRADEHIEYYGRYIAKVPEGDLISMLREQAVETMTLLQDLPPAKADYAYAPGKWTVKQVVGHITDAERIFGYRALRFARQDSTELPGFDENAYVDHANFNDHTLVALLDELQVVRASTIQFAKNLDPAAYERRGSANGNPISVRALLYIIAGHERHHVELLRERYLSH